MDHRPKASDWLLLFILALIWGSSFILMKKGLESFRPDQVAALRIAITGIVLLPFAFMRNKEVTGPQRRMIFIQGFFGNFIPAFLFPAAQSHIDSSTAGILNSLAPVWVFILGIFFFSARYTWVKLLGIAFAFGGVILLMALQPQHGSTSNINFAWLIVFATVCYGINTNLIKRYLSDVKPITITAVAFAMALVPAIIYLLTTGIVTTFMDQPKALISLGYITILASLGSAVASITFNKLIQRTSALFAASVTYLIPMVALWWGFLSGEYIGIADLFAGILILAGVYLVGK